MSSFFLCLLAILRIIGASPHGASLLPRAPGDVCSLDHQRLSLVGDRLFFMGGQYQFQGDSGPATQQTLFWLSLNATFPVENLIERSLLHSIPAPNDIPVRGGGGFFRDNSSLYPFAGYDQNEPSNGRSIWRFNTSTDAWSNVSVSGGEFNFGRRRNALMASVPSLGLSFFAGGGDNRTTGMVKFDSSSPQELKWTNLTNGNGLNGEPMPAITEGQMVYVRAGKSGVLLAFGGYDTSRDGTQFSPTVGWKWDEVPMQKISVYDIESSTWYNVTATGDVPARRSKFCAAVSASPDDSSFQVTIYGGWNLAEKLAYEDVHVLAVPSFTWIKINDKNNAEAQVPKVGRILHQCVMWKESEMIVLGGHVKVQDTTGGGRLNTPSCSPAYPPLRVLDTTTFSWRTDFDPAPSYQVPSAVYTVIGGDASGKATLIRPPGGFNNSELDQIFEKRVARFVDPASRTVNTTSTSPGSVTEKPSAKQKKPVGGIVGGTIGGLALLGALAGIVLLLRRRRRKSRADPLDSWEKPELPAEQPSRCVQQSEELESQPLFSELPRNMRAELDGNIVHEAPSSPPKDSSIMFVKSAANSNHSNSTPVELDSGLYPSRVPEGG